MKKCIFILIASLLFFTGCKNDEKVPVENKKDVGLNANTTSGANNVNEEVKQVVAENTISLYNPCELITLDEISQIFGLPSTAIEIKNTSNAGKYSNSCFLSWENVEQGAKNRMFLMLQINPLPGEFEDWSNAFIQSKIENGDMGYPDKGKPYKYKSVSDFGVDVAYNDELKRIYWKANEEYVLAIFYNAGFSSKNRQRYAAKIAKIMNENLNSKL